MYSISNLKVVSITFIFMSSLFNASCQENEPMKMEEKVKGYHPFVEVGKKFYMNVYSPYQIENDHVLIITANTTIRDSLKFHEVRHIDFDNESSFYGWVAERNRVVYFGDNVKSECGKSYSNIREIYNYNLNDGDTLHPTGKEKIFDDIPLAIEYEKVVPTVDKEFGLKNQVWYWTINRLQHPYTYLERIGSTSVPFDHCLECIYVNDFDVDCDGGIVEYYSLNKVVHNDSILWQSDKKIPSKETRRNLRIKKKEKKR